MAKKPKVTRKSIQKAANKFVDNESYRIQSAERNGRSDKEVNAMGKIKRPARSDGRPMPVKGKPPLYGPSEQIDYMNKPYFYGTKPANIDKKAVLKKMVKGNKKK